MARVAKKAAVDLVVIDGVEYVRSALSGEAQANLSSLQFVDAELARLNGQIAVCQTARNSYAAALRAALPEQAQ